MKDTITKGGLIINDIKIGNILYEYNFGICIKSKVITKPILKNNQWKWQCEIIPSGEIINYEVDKQYAHMLCNLYNYEAYK